MDGKKPIVHSSSKGFISARLLGEISDIVTRNLKFSFSAQPHIVKVGPVA